jgi:uncharacterized protein YjgD (DUF1641 family)
MANPLHFKPKVDPKLELQRQLDAAPLENAEALLVAYDILKTAHANGTLDLVNGLVGGRDVIAEKISEYAKLPGGIAAIRNLLELSKILMALDPDALESISRAMVSASEEHRAEATPPSLWQLFRRSTSEDARRGLSLMTTMLVALGRSLKATPETKHK